MTADSRSAGSRRSNRVLWLGIVAFIVGLFIGLVILGWWLWPVQWSNSYPENLRPAIQEDYLRMAIDSYSVNADTALAQTRYNLLGEAGPWDLSLIQQHPGTQNPASIAAFSVAVGAVPGTPGAAPTPPPTVARALAAQSWLRLLPALCVIAVVIAALIFWLVWRSRRRRPGPVAPVAEEPEPLPPTETIEEPVFDEAALYAGAVVAADEQPYPAEKIYEADLSPAEVQEPEEPGPEILPEEGMVAALPGNGAAIVAGAAVATAAAAAEEPVPAEEAEPVYKPAKMTYKLQYVEGIGDVYAERLKAAGIHSPETLLERGSTRKGRQELATATGISGKLLLRWVNHVDLYRIKGVGEEYADLLEASGVDTVVELALRNPENLHPHLLEINEQRRLVRQPPSLAQVQDWVAQAKQLPRVVEY